MFQNADFWWQHKLDSTITVYLFALLKNIHRYVCEILRFCGLQMWKAKQENGNSDCLCGGEGNVRGWWTGVGD